MEFALLELARGSGKLAVTATEGLATFPEAGFILAWLAFARVG